MIINVVDGYTSDDQLAVLSALASIGTHHGEINMSADSPFTNTCLRGLKFEILPGARKAVQA